MALEACQRAGRSATLPSLWGILDQAAAGFSEDFYSHYLSGLRPANAVAQTQRRLIARGKPVSHWAGFISIGAP